LQAQPAPLLHVSDFEMQLSPHALPVLQILQQPFGAVESVQALS